MPGQHLENLFRRFKGEVVDVKTISGGIYSGRISEMVFRRFKGEVVDVKTISGGIYSGRISEITNDYVCLIETAGSPGQQAFWTFSASGPLAAGASGSDESF